MWLEKTSWRREHWRMCACICECVHACVHRYMCVVYLHTHLCGAAMNVCVYEHVCTCTCLACKCVCPVGSYKQSLGANNSSFGNLPCLCGSRAGEEKLLLGRADFVAWLHVRVSTWVCFN